MGQTCSKFGKKNGLKKQITKLEEENQGLKAKMAEKEEENRILKEQMIKKEEENQELKEQMAAKEENQESKEQMAAKEENQESKEQMAAKEENQESKEQMAAKEENQELKKQVPKKDKEAVKEKNEISMKSGVEKKKDSCPGPEPNISKNPLTIWLVRHAEREDNINRHWHKNANPNGLKPDNPPLSARGLIQAEELAQRFSNIIIDHIISSPLERTMQTASILLGQRKNILIKPEWGLLEPIYDERIFPSYPPGFEETAKLKRRFPLTDVHYKPIHPLPAVRENHQQWEERFFDTLNKIIYEQYKDAYSIVIVSHSAILGVILNKLAGEGQLGRLSIFPGQATVTKFVRNADGQFKMAFACDDSHLSSTLRGRIRMKKH